MIVTQRPAFAQGLGLQGSIKHENTISGMTQNAAPKKVSSQPKQNGYTRYDIGFYKGKLSRQLLWRKFGRAIL